MIVITGSSGYLGSHIYKRLAQTGRTVRAMVHKRQRAEQEGRLAGLGIEWVEGDVTHPEMLIKTFQGASAIIHTVAIAIEKGKRTYFQPIWVDDVVTCVVEALENLDTIGKEYEIAGPELLTLEEIERRTLNAVGAKRWQVHFSIPVLRLFVALMEKVLPSPPVTRSLLELLAIKNTPTDNSISLFVDDPRSFTVQNIAPYMRNFRPGQTLAQLFRK
jgi:uncharacterized protein YbjT (DUF2867 family)